MNIYNRGRRAGEYRGQPPTNQTIWKVMMLGLVAVALAITLGVLL